PDEACYDAMRDAVLDTILAGRPRPPAADPVRMLVEEGRIIDAVALLRQREKVNLATALTRVNPLRDQLRARSAPGRRAAAPSQSRRAAPRGRGTRESGGRRSRSRARSSARGAVPPAPSSCP